MRKFETGATRDNEDGKIDYDGFLSPQVLERFGQYMHRHRIQADGQLRASDNWKKGIPRDAYMKSMYRHFMEVWKAHQNLPAEDIEESLCAMFFNVQGYLFETLNDPYRNILTNRDAVRGGDSSIRHSDVQGSEANKQVPESVLERAPGLDGAETSWEDEGGACYNTFDENKKAPADSVVNCTDSSWGV
jgi:hypothetical protein